MERSIPVRCVWAAGFGFLTQDKNETVSGGLPAADIQNGKCRKKRAAWAAEDFF